MRILKFFLSGCAFFTVVLAACPALQAQTFVQANSAAQASASQVSALYTQEQVSGDVNVVVVSWRDTVAAANTVSDTQGNIYTLAVGPTTLAGQLSQSIYFARNIVAAAAGSNSVTVTFNAVATNPEVRVLEYNRVDANNPLDGAAGASGNSASTDSGPANTAYANDLLIGPALCLRARRRRELATRRDSFWRTEIWLKTSL